MKQMGQISTKSTWLSLLNTKNVFQLQVGILKLEVGIEYFPPFLHVRHFSNTLIGSLAIRS